MTKNVAHTKVITTQLTIGNVRIENLDVNLFEYTFDRATRQYNSSLQPNQVEWGYWIDQNTLEAGSGGNSKKIQGLYDLTCKDYPEISCAAAAIMYWLIMKTSTYPTTYKHNIRRISTQRKWLDEAKRLQNRMGWSKETTKLEVLSVVTNIYLDYRIVILNYLMPSSEVDSANGSNYVEQPSNDKIIYLYYDYVEKHFCAVSSPQEFIRNQLVRNDLIWCHSCTSYKCYCIELKPDRKRKLCHECGKETYSLSQHNCFNQTCKYCHLEYKVGRELSIHRCPLRANLNTIPKDFESDDTKRRQLWAYDLESQIIIDANDKTSFEFETNEDGCYTFESDDEETDPTAIKYPKHKVVPSHKQVPNFVVYKNVFTGERRETESIRTFLEDMMYATNKGNNILVAHNASGYDSRLLFDEINTMTGVQNKIINRGSKILRMEVGKTVFLDSMLHLQGSLKSLSKECLVDDPEYQNMEKGYFPHLFNRPENRNYIGPTPDINYYDLTSFCNDEKELEKFHVYYNSIKDKEDWNFWEELQKYCRQDVDILAAIMKKFHYSCLEGLESYTPHLRISPWHYTTAAGYVHKLFLYNMELDRPSAVDPIELAKKSWCVLKPTEYYFARKALRGGRTETRMHYYEGPIIDIDIASQYPSVQMAKTLQLCNETIPVLYPVGYPTIEIFDTNYYPCNDHFENPDEICSCPQHHKEQSKSIKTVFKFINPNAINNHDFINNFFGFIMIDATPPSNLYHPVLPVYDKDQEKCTFSLEPIVRGVYCSPELQLAIKKGYVVTKIYRADRYQAAPTSWGGEDGGLLGVFIKMKIMNSGNAPESAEEKEKMATYYRENFNISLDFNPELWGDNPAKKKTAKTKCNSCWGKHAESVDHEQVKIITPDTYNDADLLMQSFTDGVNQMSSFTPLNNNNMMVKFKAIRHRDPPDLSKNYVPCATFVPMYGRLMLYNVLDKYQERIIMMDTDSIKVTGDGPVRDDIPIGKMLGQWEPESTHDPLVGFISLGPKTYGQKFRSGKTTFKSKGLSLKRAHKQLINYDVAKKIYFDGVKVYIPQTVFAYKFSKGIYTKRFMKRIEFKESILKGTLDRSNNCIYPFGYIR